MKLLCMGDNQGCCSTIMFSGFHAFLFSTNDPFYGICRYHYNVADARLRQHVVKGNEDGLYISCVASVANLWALIMDAGTAFSSRVIGSWNSDISSIAGAANGS
ncbi:hypothetical protein ACH5RR_007561 [Cinchona calisaya]|uniref:DUF7477 domain-containing protein n=1 Tax=Cinchona calisaya TaxID=153742 RepID=A0ABD3AS70_9GENT